VFVLSTDPHLADPTDGDGVSDADEDIDGDGLTNAEEVNVHDTNPLVDDSDVSNNAIPALLGIFV